MIKEDELKTLIGKKIMVRLGVCYLISYSKDKLNGLYTLQVLDDYTDLDSIKTISKVCLSDIIKDPKARLSDKIIKYDKLRETAYYQDPFFFVSLDNQTCGWTFVEKLKNIEDDDDYNTFKPKYTLKGIGSVMKHDYGNKWLAFTDDVDPDLIRRKKKNVDYSKFI